MQKVSVITVCFNAIDTIEETILSVLGQKYENKEYIIIDGGSTDGTLDIIRKYSDSLYYWVSEKDKGIYDAMNKGIAIATGDWINFMNAGDYFCSCNTLSDVFSVNDYEGLDVIYGNSILKDKNGVLKKYLSDYRVQLLQYISIYRHGASFVRASTHKLYPFDLSKKKLSYALDSYCIHSMYVDGKVFKKINEDILIYSEDGISNHHFRNLYYNFIIALETKQYPKIISFYSCLIIKELLCRVKNSAAKFIQSILNLNR